MALVDYSSDNDSSGSLSGDENTKASLGNTNDMAFPLNDNKLKELPSFRPLKRKQTQAYSVEDIEAEKISQERRGTQATTRIGETWNKNAPSYLPPLPAVFHDLYAHTVRTSNMDDPDLHQGRKRQVPHIMGNWPSHVYIEWHPTRENAIAIRKLLLSVSKHLDTGFNLVSLLTSELGVALPLHVSLSRPLSLTTSNKDVFLGDLKEMITRGGIIPFEIMVCALNWHRSEESERTFLVLEVGLCHPKNASRQPEELVVLLNTCNTLAKRYGQPLLYSDGNNLKLSSNPFHVSIGWTYSPINYAMTAAAVDAHKDFDEVRRTRIQVSSIKVKIGNTVTNLPLLGTYKMEQNSSSTDSLGLF